MGTLLTKRVYDASTADDGYRVLVDRLWPRGETHERANLDLWLKDIAPSTELRTWWNHDPDRMDQFAERYQAELDENRTSVDELLALLRARPTVTLVYAAHDALINHAIVLQRYIQTHYKFTSPKGR